jgi:hypothetical protein
MRSLTMVWLALCPAALAAQSMPMAMDHGTMSTPVALTSHAKAQVERARQAAAQLDTPEKARAAGYRPRFGDVPLQGEHWSNPALVLTGTFDIDHPPILMFAPIDGTQRLLGVAYAYEVRADAPTPDGFDGAAQWHEHPALALPGRKLVMTHVWFIDSPNGVFAHDNPTLAFLERGLGYPPPGWLDAASMRKLALTLQLAQKRAPGSSRAVDGLRNDSLIGVLLQERAEVDSLVPSLESARKAGNRGAYRAIALAIGGKSDQIIATVKQLPTDPIARAFFGRLIDEALGDDHH